MKRTVARFLGDEDEPEPRQGLRTRASDTMPRLDFGEPELELKPQKPPVHARQPLKDDI